MGQFQRFDKVEPQDRLGEPIRTILIVAAAGAIPQSMLAAVQHEFAFTRIAHVDEPSAALAPFRDPVGLVLVDSGLVESIETSAEIFGSWHPKAIFAEILPVRTSMMRSFPDRSEPRLVRSGLPMEVRLDVWLSVIQLMLRGGEYVPRAAIQPARVQTDRPNLGDLTRREMQVLELVSEGNQNKAIAMRLSVSEHTIKIHLHNIITKLGASNRTEAAAHLRGHLGYSRMRSD